MNYYKDSNIGLLKTLIPFKNVYTPAKNIKSTAKMPKVIRENTENNIKFNVMPGKSVEETLYIREYRVKENSIECTYDREYHSDMERSPNHLIFTNMLTHSQKLLYVYLCHYFNMAYDPYAPEKFKIWPTHIDIKMPSLVRKNKGVTQVLYIINIEDKGEGKFVVDTKSIVEKGEVSFDASLTIFLL